MFPSQKCVNWLLFTTGHDREGIQEVNQGNNRCENSEEQVPNARYFSLINKQSLEQQVK